MDKAAPDVTHLLLPAPAFEQDGRIRGGGILAHILADLPEDVTVIGGMLRQPLLDQYRKMDLLEDPRYTAENAALTADCAIRIAARNLPVAFCRCSALIIGWGRIGKCLATMLRSLGTEVSISARKPEDLAMASALGYRAMATSTLGPELVRYRIIFNTAPAPVLSAEQCAYCEKSCIKIDLASQQGIMDPSVIWARGLPGKMVPESSGELIARSVIRLLAEKEC